MDLQLTCAIRKVILIVNEVKQNVIFSLIELFHSRQFDLLYIVNINNVC